MSFTDAIARVLDHEKGYSNRPTAEDPGGETMYGITVAVARRHGWLGRMQNIPMRLVLQIYEQDYWVPTHCAEMPEPIGFLALDFAVNSGPATAIRKLQHAAGLADDGHYGPISRATVLMRDVLPLGIAYLDERLLFMQRLSNWPANKNGWLDRIQTNKRHLIADCT